MTGRPPAALRALLGLLSAAVLVFNVVLMLADRAPRLTRRLLGDFAVRLSDRLDASERLDRLTDGNPPGGDDVVHIGVWAVATLLIGLTIWHWWGLVVAAPMVAAASIVVELAQGRYTTSRAVQASDIAANLIGIALGVTGAAAAYLLGAGIVTSLRRLRPAAASDPRVDAGEFD